MTNTETLSAQQAKDELTKLQAGAANIWTREQSRAYAKRSRELKAIIRSAQA